MLFNSVTSGKTEACYWLDWSKTLLKQIMQFYLKRNSLKLHKINQKSQIHQEHYFCFTETTCKTELIMSSSGWKKRRVNERFWPFVLKWYFFLNHLLKDNANKTDSSLPTPPKKKKPCQKAFTILQQCVGPLVIISSLFSGIHQTLYKPYFLRSVNYIIWFLVCQHLG